jgi:hypothetical protein
MSRVTIDTSITINVEQTDGMIAVLTLTLEEARALKDELIRAVGAQNPVPVKRGELHDCVFAPVIQPRGGFINTDATQQRRLETVQVGGVEKRIPEHLLKRAEQARAKAGWSCHCGDQTGCRPGHCQNVPA